MTNVINSVIDATLAQEAAELPVDVVETKQPEVEVEVESQEPSETQEEVSQEPTQEREEFPKKAVNAISYRNKQIAKLKAEVETYRAELEQFKQPKQEIKEDDYADYGEFLKAEAKAEMIAELKQQGLIKEPVQAPEYTPIEQKIISQVTPDIFTKYADYGDVIELNSHVLDAMPDRIKDLIADEPNIPELVYKMGKAGVLEQLLEASPKEAVRLIDSFSQQKQPEVKKVTQAPTPIKSASGSSVGLKSIDSMSGEDILRSIRK